jgi:thiamine-monophosphate kinase
MRRRQDGDARASASGYRKPPLRIDFAAEAGRRRLVSAMIDVSDGLLQDLGHVAQESKVAIRLDGRAVPVHRSARISAKADGLVLALTGGEDYELAFTAPRAHAAAIAKLAKKHRVPVTQIGIVERGAPAVTGMAGEPLTSGRSGFDHLVPRRPR